jgi:hypothetical protein
MALELVLISAMAIWGIHALTRYTVAYNDGIIKYAHGNLLGRIGYWFEVRSILPEWILAPLISCPYCMASFWGAFIWSWVNYSAIVAFSQNDFQLFPAFFLLVGKIVLHCMAILGINYLIDKWTN